MTNNKRIIVISSVLFVLICCPLFDLVEASSIDWSESFGATNAEIAYSVVEVSDGGFILVGLRDFFDESLNDFWLVKTDEYGELKWAQTFGGNANEIAYSVVEASDGGFALAGYTDSFGAGDLDFWLVKTDSNGNMQWNMTYGGVGGEMAYSVVEASDGGFALAGYTDSFGAGDLDFWLVKTDQYGNIGWNQTFGGMQRDSAYSLIETSNGQFVLGGVTKSFDSGNGDFWIVVPDRYVIPEFSSWISLPIFLTIILIVLIYRKKINELRI